MHVLFVTPWYPPLVSGAGAYLADIADGLIERGHRVTVLLGQGAPSDTYRDGARVVTVHGRIRGSTSMRLLVRALELHRSDPIDLVVTGGGHPAGTIGLFVARIVRRPLYVVALGEDVSVAQTSRLARTCLRRVFATASGVLAASLFTAGEVVRFGGSIDRCTVVLPAVDTERFARASAADRDDFRRRHGLEGKQVVLTVARLEPRKGHDITLTALATLVQDFHDIHYVIVGRGDQTTLRSLADRLQMADRLTIVDGVGAAELPAAYAAADVFVMLSRPDDTGQVEGFGIVYLEAAAAGLPSVAGNLGGCTDAVVDGETGACVDPSDVVAIAAAIRSMLASPEHAKELGARGRQRALTAFRHSSFKERTSAALSEATGEPGEQAPARRARRSLERGELAPRRER
jgi:phosphatidyl-myo-inositol dimannoside synthase